MKKSSLAMHSDAELVNQVVLKMAEARLAVAELAGRGLNRAKEALQNSPHAAAIDQIYRFAESPESRLVRLAMLEVSLSNRIRIPFSVRVGPDEDGDDDRRVVTFTTPAWSVSIDDYTWEDWLTNLSEEEVLQLAGILKWVNLEDVEPGIEALNEKSRVLSEGYRLKITADAISSQMADLQASLGKPLAMMERLNKDIITLAGDFIQMRNLLAEMSHGGGDVVIQAQPARMKQIASQFPTLMAP